MTSAFRHRRFSCLNASGLCWLVLAGCGPDGPRFFDVQGQVSWDGKPIAMGDILFIPEDPRLAPQAGKIRDGKYTARLREGTHRVEITALDIDGTTPIVMGSPLAENFVPPRYNEQSELTAVVTDAGGNDFTFELRSAPRSATE